jgi:uncharacterized protein (TIGR02271 family)
MKRDPLTLSDRKGTTGTLDPDSEPRDSASVPALQEQVKVRKARKETARVQISKKVKSREEVVDVPLEEEKVSVKRVPINRFVEGPVPVRREGDTLIVPLLKEVLIVEKKLLLKEEWHIHKARSIRKDSRRVQLRDEEISIKRTNPDEGTGVEAD